MPFESEAQRRWMYANHPEMAKKWQKHTPKGKKLPEKKAWLQTPFDLWDKQAGRQDELPYTQRHIQRIGIAKKIRDPAKVWAHAHRVLKRRHEPSLRSKDMELWRQQLSPKHEGLKLSGVRALMGFVQSVHARCLPKMAGSVMTSPGPVLDETPYRGEQPAAQVMRVTDAPLGAGTSIDGSKILKDKHMPHKLLTNTGKTVDVDRSIAHHESKERRLMDLGLPYSEAHPRAEQYENEKLKQEQGLTTPEVQSYEHKILPSVHAAEQDQHVDPELDPRVRRASKQACLRRLQWLQGHNCR